MRELETLIQHCFDTHLDLLKEVRELLPILGEPTPLPLLVKMFGEWETELVKKRVSGMVVVRAQCVVVARAVSPVTKEEEVAFRERFLGKEEGVVKKVRMQ